MKVSIEGFNQQVALGFVKEVPCKDKTKTIRLDCTDLVVLRWFVDFYPNMKKIEIDGKQYAWLTHSKIEEDLPILNISKKAYIDRLHKLVEFDILTYKFIKEGGSFSVYGFGEQYEKLVLNSRGVDGQPTTGGVWSTDYPVYGQPTTKDKTIIYKTIKDNKYIYSRVIEYLNEKANTSYKSSTKKTQQLINARLSEGYSVEDFITVIDKKCAEWVGTQFEQYLKPDTLFSTKFEGYLNQNIRKENNGQARKFGADTTRQTGVFDPSYADAITEELPSWYTDAD